MENVRRGNERELALAQERRGCAHIADSEDDFVLVRSEALR
jgi:hypothetical protein